MKLTNIVLASHGTPGALAAEQAALNLAVESGAAIRHLFVVPDFWKEMRGDDWLNNAVTQIRFGNYVENRLALEAAEVIDRLAGEAADLSVDYASVSRFGKPVDCLLAECAAQACDLVLIGSPRPRGVPGLRSRMMLDPLVGRLNVPLMIVPHPQHPSTHDP